MDRLLTMDREQFISRMQADVRQTLEQIADAVNDAPTGNVINASEMQVRDLMAAFRHKAFELAVQMRIDSTESGFSPSQGPEGKGQAEQGTSRPQHVERERTDRAEPNPLVRRRRRQ